MCAADGAADRWVVEERQGQISVSAIRDEDNPGYPSRLGLIVRYRLEWYVLLLFFLFALALTSIDLEGGEGSRLRGTLRYGNVTPKTCRYPESPAETRPEYGLVTQPLWASG